MTRHEPPSLEQRIAAVLTTQNAGGGLLVDLIREVESAAQTAGQTASDERAKAVDLVQSPDAKAAHERVVDAEMTRDRLKNVLPKLRDKLTESLAEEERDRWWQDYRKVKAKVEEAVELFKQYPEHAEAVAAMFALAADIDREVSRINGSAPGGIDRRLQSVELTARAMTGFTREQPSVAANTVLPRWDASARTVWPAKPSTSLAVAYAESMIPPPHPGGAWADPEVRVQRRTEVEKSQRELVAYYEQAARDEEDRKNREERKRAGAHRRG